MKRLSGTKLTLLAIAATAASPALAGPVDRALEKAPPFASGAQQIRAVASGVIEFIRGEEASLQTSCSPIGPIGALVVQRRITYTALAGACGTPGLAACDGRITEITEGCLGPDSLTTDINVGGIEIGAIYRMSNGKVRRCFDATGASDCTGATPLGEIISEGEEPTYGILRDDPANPNRVIVNNTAYVLGFEIADIDGRSVSEGDAVHLRSIYGEGVDPAVCGWRGIIEAGGFGTGLRACEFIVHDTGSASN